MMILNEMELDRHILDKGDRIEFSLACSGAVQGVCQVRRAAAGPVLERLSCFEVTAGRGLEVAQVFQEAADEWWKDAASC